MNASDLSPSVDLRLEFSLKSLKFVPAGPGCYALTTYEGTVLYVGLSENLQVRFGQHRESRKKNDATPFGRAIWFYYVQADLKSINKIERAWLNQHMDMHGDFPFLNKMASPVR